MEKPIDIPKVRNTMSMFSCEMLTDMSCEHNKHSQISTGPCDTCKSRSLYGTSPKTGSSCTSSMGYGSSPLGSGFNMGHFHDVTKDSSHKREVHWSDNDKEIIPDDDDDINMIRTCRGYKTYPKTILKHRAICTVVVYEAD